jgi:hypothetical protein
VEPSEQADCKTGAAALNSSNAPKCFTNNDPAAIFSTKKSFGTLWTQANQSNSENVYSLATCIEISGHWYLYTPSS